MFRPPLIVAPDRRPRKAGVVQNDKSTPSEPDDDREADAQSPEIRAFAELWLSKTLGDRLPARADLTIEELQPWLGRLLIMDVLDGGDDFRYRLVGTLIADANDRDLTGKCVSECQYDGHRDHVLASFRAPIETRGPVFRNGRMVWNPEKGWRRYESIHCPLATNGSDVDMTIGLHVYFQDDA